MTFSIAKREAAMMAKEPATLMDADQEPVMSLSTPIKDKKNAIKIHLKTFKIVKFLRTSEENISLLQLLVLGMAMFIHFPCWFKI